MKVTTIEDSGKRCPRCQECGKVRHRVIEDVQRDLLGGVTSIKHVTPYLCRGCGNTFEDGSVKLTRAPIEDRVHR